jgi:adenylate cyclase
MRKRDLLHELKRRKVVRAALVYAATAFVVLQAADLLASGLKLPGWFFPAVTVLALLGLPVALVLSWVFDLTRDGMQPTPAAGGDLDIPLLGRRTLLLTAGLLLVGLGLGAGWVLKPVPGAPQDGDAASIAVLPFANLSGDAANDYLSDGISEEILNALARLPNLRVIGRTSSFQFRGDAIDARYVGRELAVGAVLAGSVQRADDAVRVTAELVDARTGVRLWSDRFDRRLQHLFVLEDDIARAVLQALAPQLASGTDRPLVAQATSSAAAHDAVLRANALARNSNEPSLEQAIRLYRDAIGLDPQYAAAWAGLANAYYWLGDAYRAPRDVAWLAHEAALRAVALDSTLAAGHVLLGGIAVIWDRDFATARRALDRALALDPGVAAVHAYLGTLLLAADGDAAAARAAFQKATTLDPLDPFLPWLEIHAALAERHFDDALRLAERIRTIEPDFFYFMDQRAAVHMAAGRWGDCVDVHAALPAALRAQPQYALAICLAQNGDTAQARSILARLDDEAARRYVDATTIATVHAALGELDRAFEWLERAFDDRSARLSFIRMLPEFEPLRGDARYAAFISRLGVR